MEWLFVAVALLAGLGIGGLGGWLVGGRGQAAAAAARLAAETALTEAREAADRRQEALGRAVAEVAAYKARAVELTPLAARVPQLSAQVAALEATQQERDRGNAERLAQLHTEFQRLAGEALERAQAKFTEQAAGALELNRVKAEHDLEGNRVALDAMLKPIDESLKRYEADLKRVEAERVGTYEGLREMIGGLAGEQVRGREAVLRLETALRSSGKVAGRWGEEQCRNVLEAAGLVEGTDFRTQVQQTGESGTFRPDFIITLPGDRELVIDVKCSLDSYMEAAATDDHSVRSTALKAHSRAVRTHASGLLGKDYSKLFSKAVEFVVMFVPGENFLHAALEADRALFNDFFDKKIVLAGPVNLIAVARTVAAMRDQQRLAKEAAEIAKLGRDLYDALRIMGGNMSAVQKSLSKTVENFNDLVSQMDSRVMLRARRFEGLGATTGLQAIPDLSGVERLPQLPAAPEMLPPLANDRAA